MSALQWNDETTLHGVHIKAFFFDGEQAQSAPTLIGRALPMLAAAPVLPSVLAVEEDRKNYKIQQMIAQPDAVFSHGSGLVCVEYKSVGGRNHSPQHWKQAIRLGGMLQALIASYVVAQSQRKVTACVLRYHNVAYLLVPTPALIQLLVGMVPMATAYYQDKHRVAARQLAKFAQELENWDLFALLPHHPSVPPTAALVYSGGFGASALRVRSAAGRLLSFSGTLSEANQRQVEHLLKGPSEGDSGIDGQASFFGDLDWSGVRILAALRRAFPSLTAWKPGYEALLRALAEEQSHRPEETGKQGQRAFAAEERTGCSYADEVLVPALRGGRFVDQEVFLSRFEL